MHAPMCALGLLTSAGSTRFAPCFHPQHTAGELASLISIELDTIRSFVFRCGHN